MDWFKCSTRLFQNPKVMLAGEDGVLLFVQLLSLNAQEELDGAVRGARAKPEFLARLMSLLSLTWNEERVSHALEACVEAGLLAMAADGEIHISGWDDTWRPARTPAQRKRDERARKRTADVTEDQDGCHASDVTPRDTARDTVTPRGEGREERRERGGDEVDSSSRSPRSPSTSSAEGEPSSGQGPARPPAPPPRGRRTVDERRAELPPAAKQHLEVLEEFLGDGKGPGAHELVDVAWHLERERWRSAWVRELLDRARAGGGRWRRKAVDVLRDAGKRRAWRTECEQAGERARRLDHHFGSDFERRCREEAHRDCTELGMSPEDYHELTIAERYRQTVLHGEQRLEDVPTRYRKHLPRDSKLPISPHAIVRRKREPVERAKETGT